MNNIKLIALDLDGTLFDNQSRISENNLAQIRRVSEKGVNVVISTGRPFAGLPFDQIKNSGIRYAITTNGSAIYDIDQEKCLYQNCMPPDITLPIIKFLQCKEIHMDAFIDGVGYSQHSCLHVAERLDMPPSLKNYILYTRKRVDDLYVYVKDNDLQIQKMTLNFMPDGKGGHVDRDAVLDFLNNNPKVNTVCGGYSNLEFTKATVDKGRGLLALAEILSVDQSETMAVGDTENDLAIIRAAHIGVAMGNATAEVKAAADYCTQDNSHDGVAQAIAHFVE